MTQTADTPALAPRLSSGDVLARLGPFLGILIVFVTFALVTPRNFLSLDNFANLFRQTTVVATAALGMTLIIIAGGIDLSVGSSIALCTVITARLMVLFVGDGGGAPSASLALLAAALGALACALAGAIIGSLVTAFRLAPFVVTLGLWSALRGVAKLLASDTTVNAPRTWLSSALKTRPAWDIPERPSISFYMTRFGAWIFSLPWGVWLVVFLAVIVALALRYTRFGRHIYAIGSSEPTARLCGVRVTRAKILVYSLAGLLFGIAGVLQFIFLSQGDPTTANGMELDIIAAVVVGGASLSGGRGSVLGTTIGALMMAMVANGCANVPNMSNSWQQVITGGIIILAVTVDHLRKRTAA